MAAGDVLPRFYTVFVSSISSNSLLIPSSYYEFLPRRLPKTAILMGTGGKFWKVAMMSKREQVYFEQGWGNFVADNELKDGEFLTFVFDGHQSYEVSIYGHGGCKEIRAAIEVEEISDETEGENSDDDSLVDITPMPVQDISDESASDKDYCPESEGITTISFEAAEVASTTVTSRRKRVKKTIENPTAYLDDPTNLYFVAYLKNRKNELIVDAQLVKDYCLQFADMVDYIDGYGKLTAQMRKWADRRVAINKWHKICERNRLTENDTILCEVLRSSNDKVVYAIKVHIIREVEANT